MAVVLLRYLPKPFDLDEATALVKRVLTIRTDWQTALRQSVDEQLAIGSSDLLADLGVEFDRILLQAALAFTKRPEARSGTPNRLEP